MNYGSKSWETIGIYIDESRTPYLKLFVSIKLHFERNRPWHWLMMCWSRRSRRSRIKASSAIIREWCKQKRRCQGKWCTRLSATLDWHLLNTEWRNSTEYHLKLDTIFIPIPTIGQQDNNKAVPTKKLPTGTRTTKVDAGKPKKEKGFFWRNVNQFLEPNQVRTRAVIRRTLRGSLRRLVRGSRDRTYAEPCLERFAASLPVSLRILSGLIDRTSEQGPKSTVAKSA